MDYFNENPGKLDNDRILRKKGIDATIHHPFIRLLVIDGLLHKTEDDFYSVTSKWTQFFDVTQDFDSDNPSKPGFWQIFKKHGNKQMAKKAYFKARKVVDKETLHAAAIRYIKSKEGNDIFLHASTYLNPETRHWEDVVFIKGEKEELTKGIYQGSITQKKNPNGEK
jgi:hypothetical protein